jgi:hypothetical protein
MECGPHRHVWTDASHRETKNAAFLIDNECARVSGSTDTLCAELSDLIIFEAQTASLPSVLIVVGDRSKTHALREMSAYDNVRNVLARCDIEVETA